MRRKGNKCNPAVVLAFVPVIIQAAVIKRKITGNYLTAYETTKGYIVIKCKKYGDQERGVHLRERKRKKILALPGGVFDAYYGRDNRMYR